MTVLRKSLFLFMLFTFLILLLLYPRAAQAGSTFVWTGNGDDAINWIDPCNWHPKDACEMTYPGMESDDDEVILGPEINHVIHPGAVTLKTLTILGAAYLQGGDVTVTETFQWHDGWIGAKITVASGATMDIRDDIYPAHSLTLVDGEFGRGEIVLHGSGLWSGGGQITFWGDTIINNHGTFTIEGAATLFGGSCCLPPTSNFNNYGTLVVATPLVPLVPNQAMVDNISFIHQGVIQVHEGAELTLGGGNHELHEGSRFTGDGRTIIAKTVGDPRIEGAVAIDPGATVELRSNSLQGEGTFEGGGTVNWTGGEVRGNLTIAEDTTLLISGPGDKRIVRQDNNGEISARGNVRWEDAGRMYFAGPGIFNNHGVFEIKGDATFQAGSCCRPPTSVFNNFGALKIRGVSSAFNGVFVNNAGEIEVIEGTLSVAGGARYTQTAGATRIDTGAVQTAHELRIEGGRLEGTGVITGNVYSSGEVHPGLSTGILRIVGQYTQAPTGRLAIEIAGTTVGTEFDQLQVSGLATLDGTLDVSIGDDFDPAGGESFPILLVGSRSGDFSAKLGLNLDESKALAVVYNPDGLTLTVHTDGYALFLPSLQH